MSATVPSLDPYPLTRLEELEVSLSPQGAARPMPELAGSVRGALTAADGASADVVVFHAQHGANQGLTVICGQHVVNATSGEKGLLVTWRPLLTVTHASINTPAVGDDLRPILRLSFADTTSWSIGPIDEWWNTVVTGDFQRVLATLQRLRSVPLDGPR